jgi:hypothetical protein
MLAHIGEDLNDMVQYDDRQKEASFAYLLHLTSALRSSEIDYSCRDKVGHVEELMVTLKPPSAS